MGQRSHIVNLREEYNFTVEQIGNIYLKMTLL